MNGYIALHRKTIYSAVFQDAELFKLWVYCLCRVTYKPRQFVHGSQVVELEAGQFITGRKVLAEQLNCTERSVRTRLATLEKLGNIVVKSTNKYSVITVVNWDYYQQGKEKVTSKRPASDQQVTTNNKGNKDNNILGEASSPQETMNWKKQSDDYEEGVIDIDGDGELREEKPKKHTKTTPEMKQLFEMFNNPAKKAWHMYKHEREAAQILIDTYGLETLEKRIKRIEIEKKKNAGDSFMPVINSPSTMLKKMEAMENYLGL